MTESVWDYPRPPRIELDNRLVTVITDGQLLAESSASIRVLETSHPPVFYIPQADTDNERLSLNTSRSFCEFKGEARYWNLLTPRAIDDVGWSYLEPAPGYEPLAGMIAFYPSKVSCAVDGKVVKPQQGGFYGGWITPEIVGPFKGGPGTSGW